MSERDQWIRYGAEELLSQLICFLSMGKDKGLDLAGAIKIMKTGKWINDQACMQVQIEIAKPTVDEIILIEDPNKPFGFKSAEEVTLSETEFLRKLAVGE